ncbi:MAG: hypothetical protein ACJ8AK_06360 [Gemmatimonadaceae bacterium]
MPKYDVIERHRAVVAAGTDTVYAALRRADLASGPLAKLLLAVRAIPSALIASFRSPGSAFVELRAARKPRAQRPRAIRLADFERAGFHVVAERVPEEIVIGLLGKFWTPRGALRATLSIDDFHKGPPNGYALAGWNFTVAARPDGLTELATETRVWCAEDARVKFRAYWLVVRPGSGLIRRSMLGAIRREAEREEPLSVVHQLNK